MCVIITQISMLAIDLRLSALFLPLISYLTAANSSDEWEGNDAPWQHASRADHVLSTYSSRR
jgi:hypothetical protein